MIKVRKIKDYPDYAISKKGIIIRLADNKNTKSRTWIGRIIKGNIGWHGYRMVTLINKNGPSTHYVHRLVIRTYINKNINLSNIREDEHVNHKDNNKSNNHVDNLEIVTRSENVQHAYLTKGFNLPFSRAKLTVREVIKIREMLRKGRKIADVARRYKVQWNTINRINKNYTWKFV